MLNINPLRFLGIIQPPPSPGMERMATVVNASPLAIQFDGETPYFYDAIPAVSAAFATGQRVIVKRIANAWVITNLIGLILPFAYPTSYTNWTTVWSTTTGINTPAKVNGVFTFRYVLLGTVCILDFNIVMGTTTTFGGGGAGDNWQWSLPVTPASSGKKGFAAAVNSANSSWPLAPQVTAGNNNLTFMLIGCGVTSAGLTVNGTNGGVLDAVTPFTWTASTANFINGQIIYEV